MAKALIKFAKVWFWLLIAACFLFGVLVLISIDAAWRSVVGGYKDIAKVNDSILEALFAVSCCAVIFSLLSYNVYYSDWKKLKYGYCCLFGILACIHFPLSIALTVIDKKEDAEELYNEDAIPIFKQYFQDDSLKKTIDRIQKSFHCCGAYSKEEFGLKMPVTCCKQPRTVVRDCSRMRANKMPCIEALQSSYVRIMDFIVAENFLVACIELLLSLIMYYLALHYTPEKKPYNRENGSDEDESVPNDEEIEPDEEGTSCLTDCE